MLIVPVNRFWGLAKMVTEEVTLPTAADIEFAGG
jgi:hypothetical protein